MYPTSRPVKGTMHFLMICDTASYLSKLEKFTKFYIGAHTLKILIQNYLIHFQHHKLPWQNEDNRLTLGLKLGDGAVTKRKAVQCI